MNTELAVAVVGVAGGIVVALLGNWDKLFPKENLIKATFAGYRPTGDLPTELRYFIDVSGTRRLLEASQRQMLLNSRMVALAERPEAAEEINNLYDAIEREAIQLDDVVRAMIPVYQKHFTLAELQELNKFYSTDAMQTMLRKLPELAQDAAPIQVRMQNDYFDRVQARLQSTAQA
jgi:hypothetical protein